MKFASYYFKKPCKNIFTIVLWIRAFTGIINSGAYSIIKPVAVSLLFIPALYNIFGQG